MSRAWARRRCLASAAALLPWAALASEADDAARLFGGPFSLVDHHGRPVSERDFAGRHLLVTFGYTGCPDICPLTLAIIAEALDRLGQVARELRVAFVTVDPERDDPARLHAYLAAIDARFVGLTGSEAQVAAAARAFRVHRRKVSLGADRADGYLVDHGTLTYLMDRAGRFVTLLPYGTDAVRMAEVLERHLRAAA